MRNSVYIFSYGSNLLFERIRNRVVSVEVVENYKLDGYQLSFNKKSRDGSTKANLVRTDDFNDHVWGVIHRMDFSCRLILDQYEGLGKGYDLHHFSHTKLKNNVHFYISVEDQYLTKGDPYGWYLKFVVEGAIQNGFPGSYIDQLKKVVPILDKDTDRRGLNNKILTSRFY